MSFYRKKLLFPILILCTQIFLASCFPIGEDPPDADLGEVGEPQVSCGKVGEVRVSYPISPLISGGYHNVQFHVGADTYGAEGAEWTTDIVSWSLPVPQIPEEVPLELFISWEYDDGAFNTLKDNEHRQDTVTLPTCEIEAASPSEEEAHDSDGTPIIQSAKCTVSYQFTTLQIDVHFPHSAGGLKDSYVGFMNGKPGTLDFRLNENQTLRFVYLLPEESPVNFVLRSRSSNDVVMITTIDWDECNDPDGIPVILNSTCVGKGESKQLMIVFEFEQEVIGEYGAFVADIPYQLAPVTSYPNRLYYFGTPPPQGSITIRLVSTSNQAIAYEEMYTPVVCGPQEEKEDDDDGGYTPPNY